MDKERKAKAGACLGSNVITLAPFIVLNHHRQGGRDLGTAPSGFFNWFLLLIVSLPWASYLVPIFQAQGKETEEETQRNPAVRLCRSRFPGEPEIKGPEGPEQVL